MKNATAFACDLARVHRSVAECDACTWWSPPDLVSDRQILRGKIEPSDDRPDGDAPAPPLRPSTSWWMCVNKPSTSELLRARTSKFIQLVQIAITSGLLHAPSLAPYVLYMHEREEDFDDERDELGRWLRAQGVRVVNAKLSFAKHIPPIRWRMKTLTGICKMDIPRAAHALAGELASRNLDPHRILWTDADIIWAGDWSFPVSAPLPTFAAGTETFSGSLNSGVIYGNVSTMVNEWPAMLAYAIKRRFKFTVADQSWMSLWFGKKRWQVLDDEMFNARPFIHPLRKRLVGDDGALLSADLAPPVTQPRLWHWHGYKSGDVQCWLDAMANGSWPERAWRKPECVGRLRGRGACSYKPIRGSGCRYLGRISPGPCYLRTYTYLLRQSERLLALAQRATAPVTSLSISSNRSRTGGGAWIDIGS